MSHLRDELLRPRLRMGRRDLPSNVEPLAARCKNEHDGGSNDERQNPTPSSDEAYHAPGSVSGSGGGGGCCASSSATQLRIIRPSVS